MSFMPVVLFILGIIVLIGAWRLGNPSNTSPELIAALKGVAGVKREISYIRTELKETEARMEEHERLIQEQESLRQTAVEDVRFENNTIKEAEAKEIMQEQSFNPKNRERYDLIPEFQAEVEAETETETDEDVDEEKTYSSKATPRFFSDKYRWVIELHEQGWSVLEISGHLAISQDAVNMVLNTYPRGVRL